MTKEGASCNFFPTPEGLHAFDVDRKTDGFIFVKHIVDNKTKEGSSMCHFVRGRDEDAPQPSGSKKFQFARVKCDEESTMTHNNAVVIEDEDIGTISGSAKRFTKYYRHKAKAIRRFQHVSGFPFDETIEHSVEKNRVKSSLITARDVEMSIEILGLSKHTAQCKTTRKHSAPINVTL